MYIIDFIIYFVRALRDPLSKKKKRKGFYILKMEVG